MYERSWQAIRLPNDSASDSHHAIMPSMLRACHHAIMPSCHHAISHLYLSSIAAMVATSAARVKAN
jgi:hypothetical protein